MAKKGKHGELSWHKGSSRWCKKYKDGVKPTAGWILSQNLDPVSRRGSGRPKIGL